MSDTLEYVAFWSGDRIADVFEAAAAIMHTGDYHGLLQTAALLGFLLMMVGAAVRYRSDEITVWAGVVLFFAFGLLIPKVPVTVSDPKAGTVRVVEEVPLGLAFPVCAANTLSVWMAEAFETALGCVESQRFTKFGAAFPQRAVEALYTAGPVDPEVRTLLRGFVESCVATEVLTDETKLTALTRAPSLYELLLSGNWVNPARRVFLEGKLYSCKAATDVVKAAIEEDLKKVEEALVLKLSGSSDWMLREAVRKATAESETVFLGTSRSLQESLRHAVLLNTLPQGLGDFAKRSAAPVASAVEMAKAQGNLATEINYRASAEIAEAALPKLRGLLEVLIIGVFPVMMVLALALGRGATSMLRFYLVLLAWLALWAPIASVVNYLTFMDSDPVSALVKLYGGVTLEAADVIRKAGTSSEAMAGTLMMLVPVISFAIAKVSDNGAAAWASSVLSPAQAAASSQGASLSAGNLSIGNTSVGNTGLNSTNANKSDVSTSLTHGDILTLGTPYGTANVDMSSGTVTAASRRRSDLGVDLSNSDVMSQGTGRTVSSSASYASNDTTADRLSSGYMTTAGHAYNSSESTVHTSSLTNNTISNTGHDSSYSRTVGTGEATSLDMGATNTESVAYRSNLGVRFGRGINQSVFSGPDQGTSMEELLSNQSDPLLSGLFSGQPAFSGPIHHSVFNDKLNVAISGLGKGSKNTTSGKNDDIPSLSRSASILSLEVSPNISINSGNSISDSATLGFNSTSNQSSSIRESNSFAKTENEGESFSSTNSSLSQNSLSDQHSKSLSKDMLNVQSRQTQFSSGKTESVSEQSQQSVSYDRNYMVLEQGLEQFGGVQSLLRHATMRGGEQLSINPRQQVRDENRAAHHAPEVELPQVHLPDSLREEYQQRESELLMMYAPVTPPAPALQRPAKTVTVAEEKFEHLEKEHKRHKEAASEYRNDESGVSTAVGNVFLGGLGYDSPHDKLRKPN